MRKTVIFEEVTFSGQTSITNFLEIQCKVQFIMDCTYEITYFDEGILPQFGVYFHVESFHPKFGTNQVMNIQIPNVSTEKLSGVHWQAVIDRLHEKTFGLIEKLMDRKDCKKLTNECKACLTDENRKPISLPCKN